LHWESGGCETGALNVFKKKMSTGNHFEEEEEEEDIYPDK
jgi:hypothetical protein